MRFATSYYPEITDAEAWANDISAMRAAGLCAIRVGEFAWSAIEPREGEYDFVWLDRFLDLAGSSGLEVVLCTPTATPPVWMTDRYPEVMVVERTGRRRAPGGRRDVDLDSPVFRHYAAEIASALGRRYGHHPAVIGWQLDNELIGPEGAEPLCHTAAHAFRFRLFLKRRYDNSLEALNRAWGTQFWSQRYTEWGQINPPENPRTCVGHILDYARFFSHSLASFLRLQRDALKPWIAPRQWISHNATAMFDRGIDHVLCQRELDVAAWDAYPGAAGRPFPQAFSAFAHDLIRSVHRAPFWALETDPLTGRATDAFYAEMHARGCHTAVFWHWRAHPANAENESDVICDVTGRPDPARLSRLKELLSDPAMRETPVEQVPAAKAALLYSVDCFRPELTLDPYRPREIGYLRAVISTYRALRQLGIAADIVRPGDDLDGYAVLYAPGLRLIDLDTAQAIHHFVHDGGLLVATAKCAQQDEAGAYTQPPGVRLADVLGAVQSRNVLLDPQAVPLVRHLDGTTDEALPCVERLELRGATMLASFESPAGLAGAPALVEHTFGRGRVLYAAAVSDSLNVRLALRSAMDAGLFHVPNTDDRVGIFPDFDRQHLWLFNDDATTEVWIADTMLAPGGFARVPHPASVQPFHKLPDNRITAP